MKAPIKRSTQIITQPFRGDLHRGVDLRSVNFMTWKKQAVVAPEECVILRMGVDGYGNDFIIMQPRETDFVEELKFIHVKYNNNFTIGEILEPGAKIGYTAVRQDYRPQRSNSTAHHLHFEVWRDGEPIDPTIYFDYRGIQYDYK